MNKNPITLITFASKNDHDSVGLALSRLGYRYDSMLLDDQSDLQSIVNKSHKAGFVFVFGAAMPDREKLSASLKSAGGKPCLGLFIEEQVKPDSHLVCLMNEFSSWPCSELELELRLKRIVHDSESADYPDIDQPLLDELLKLNIVGHSRALVNTLRSIKKISACESPVLIEGETGTGKELAARALHYLSDRRNHPFVPVNCGALPEQLVENELFGHEKGAYTDAGSARAGLVAQASGGTLFLDEVEALSPRAQVTLLRFLQEDEYRPLGGQQSLKANVRVVAASNSPLQELVQKGDFRQDLFYRLDIMSIVLPPLRERGSDVKLLAEHFVSLYRSQYNRPDKFLHPATLAVLDQYDWPGNVRQLENTIHRAFLLSDEAAIHIMAEQLSTAGMNDQNQLSVYPPISTEFNHAKARVIREFEENYLINILRESSGNITLAAKKAGKERRAFGKLLKKYSISRDSI